MNIHIVTERFLLRDLELTDAEGIFKLDSEPDVHEFLGKKPIKTIDEAVKIIEHVRAQYQRNGIGRWAIIDKETNDFVGWSGLKYEEGLRKEFNYYDLVYRLRKEYWGNGIATETAYESLQYGFEQLKLKEIGAAAAINHVVSNRILKKIGLKFVETFEYDNTLHNWYKLEKSDWLKNKR